MLFEITSRYAGNWCSEIIIDDFMIKQCRLPIEEMLVPYFQDAGQKAFEAGYIDKTLNAADLIAYDATGKTYSGYWRKEPITCQNDTQQLHKKLSTV